MKLRFVRRRLPRVTAVSREARKLVLDEADVSGSKKDGRIYAKLFLVRRATDLGRLWKLGDAPPPGRDTVGVVSDIGQHVIDCSRDSERELYEVDRRYFAVIGLAKGWLTNEVLAHESVHVAAAYAARLARGGPVDMTDHETQERVAHVTGWVYGKLHRALELMGREVRPVWP